MAEWKQGRSAVLAQRGMVVTDHPLASAAGLAVLEQDGNAIDAAVCVSAVLGVVLPMMNGVGGDTFATYYDAGTGRVTTLLGSGAAPKAATPAWFAAHGHTGMPLRGMLSPSVPGAVDAMAVALARWGSGRFTLDRLLAPAIHYAESGFPLSERVASWFAESEDLLRRHPSSARIYLPDGRAPRVGDILVQRDLARSLRTIAADGPRALYEGPLADRIAAYMRGHGGLMTREDLAAHRSEIADPVAAPYRDLVVHTTPPPSQGFVLLEMLNILAGDDLGALPWGSADAVHLAVEAKKLAFADRLAYVGDPRFVANPLDRLLDPAYAKGRRAALDLRRAIDAAVPGALPEAAGDTTAFAVADRHGDVVSWITSISSAFGCGEVVDGTGILLNNRAGRGFSLVPGHPNLIAPGKRTMHTLMAFIATRGGRPALAWATRGGDAQAQWDFQVLMNLTAYRLNVQDAVERPRWFSFPSTDPETVGAPFELRMEAGFPAETYEELRRRGHRVITPRPGIGGVQAIEVDAERGVYAGGSDPRADGCAIGC
ncbi:MAG TPA: gamma-glutamyltransferase [bacterium]|nr:gamma-glutamyltransferase [bacterium]